MSGDPIPLHRNAVANAPAEATPSLETAAEAALRTYADSVAFAKEAAEEFKASVLACQTLAEQVAGIPTTDQRTKAAAEKVAEFLKREGSGL
jgi:hypothetical protein